ncbi:hypothetical protein BV898_04587 [Hypsibius exemplaris]|uniref:EF-hand domain-containing protein n=1 Tax=Hypsibius exemplaris TaxID=2072580 RepID=A0A1W0X1P5_HYPEX|nr:hypothetical protein BV898_04587 [Hypsibius exemplaris]
MAGWFPFSDIKNVLRKFTDAIVKENRNAVSDLRSTLEGLDNMRTKSVDWNLFMDVLLDIGKSSLNPHEYNALARKYFFYPRISTEKRRELLRTRLQQALRQHLWEPRRNLLAALIRWDVYGRGSVSRQEMSRTIKATKMPVKADLTTVYLDLVEHADGKVDIEGVVSDLDWIRNPGVSIPAVPQKVQLA